MSRRRKIQLLCWAYFWLVIFEGALRKWILPGVSTPLLVVRDPIAIAAIIMGLPYLCRRPWAGWFGWLWGIGGVALALALIAGHGDLPTALFGARVLLFHFPLIFLFAAVFNRDDVWKFVRALALVAIPMVVLLGMQFSRSPAHWLNIAPGGEETSAFGGALGKFRCSGTFSFTNGVAEFFALASAGVVAWLLGGPRPIPKWLWISVASLVAALPLSISRGLLFKYAGVIAAALVGGLRSGGKIQVLVGGSLIAGVLAVGVSFLPVVQEAQEAFEMRWQQATDIEGGDEGVSGVLERRVGNNTLGALVEAFNRPLLGLGIGLGTNVGAMRIAGRRTFLVAEGAWPATIGELGPILGILLLLLRVCLALYLIRQAWLQAARGNALPMVFSGFSVVLVVMGDTAQPTGLGFLVLGAGLTLAGCNPTERELRSKHNAGRMPKSQHAMPRPALPERGFVVQTGAPVPPSERAEVPRTSA